jgi:hypothetical protein
MEFSKAQQVGPETLENTLYDLFILASGYEQRTVYIPLTFDIKAVSKIALAFTERSRELSRKTNDEFLIKKGFRLIPVSGEQNIDFNRILNEIPQKANGEHLNILVDYSCMTRVWYSGLINFIISDSSLKHDLTVHFSYTPAKFNDSLNNSSVRVQSRISYPSRREPDPAKPAALVIGLGLDQKLPEFILEKIKPSLLVLMYADPANDSKYIQRVLSNNNEIIFRTEVRNLFSYPLEDLKKTNEILTDLCLSLRVKYNIVLAPVGPKILSLLSLLLASRYPDINVIRVSPGSHSRAIERVSCSQPLVYSVDFTSDHSEE